jgi:sugar lactone lactonase YvrE
MPKWIQKGIAVAGGNGRGNALNQLNCPIALCVDNDQTIYVADHFNHRILEWKSGATSGKVVAGGNEQGNRNNQLNSPTDVVVDNETDSLIICDYGNKRVVRWPRQNGTIGETVISNIGCWGLAMDNDG